MAYPNPEPQFDGDVNRYISDEAAASNWFDRGAKAIFINGMGNSGADHKESALVISLLQMCEVIGVYNEKDGFIGDLAQCLGDKFQFDGPLARDPSEALDRAMKKLGGSVDRATAMEQALARNPACQSLFRVLRDPLNRNAPIHAHSQGNLILSNALSAVQAVDGPQAIMGREVHSFGSPAVNWPKGILHQEYGFTFDPVTWLAGFDFSFSISKVGVHQYEGGRTLISHGFKVYAANDPAFVINRFRWGSLGVTVSMDEDGLAEALVGMRGNLQRVYPIFQRLESKHNSDSDDVAVLYVEKLQSSPHNQVIVNALKQHKDLKTLLIRVMEKGWTGSDERKAIDFLKKL
ncbi:MAG: hypothetical protein R3C53_06485 [Pirellulaceae bacterium]